MSPRAWLLLAGALCGPRVALELLERAQRRAELDVDDQAELWPRWWWLVPDSGDCAPFRR